MKHIVCKLPFVMIIGLAIVLVCRCLKKIVHRGERDYFKVRRVV